MTTLLDTHDATLAAECVIRAAEQMCKQTGKTQFVEMGGWKKYSYDARAHYESHGAIAVKVDGSFAHALCYGFVVESLSSRESAVEMLAASMGSGSL